ncbi:MAG TPA: lysophospholipid acyltransferase family protein [Candidatus Dormibacteraeota bacterium]|nr:lysophospholipid acyltransferase family protein [Candidatus Dormibacteraeota bacterium]
MRAPLRFRAARALLRLLLGSVFRVSVEDVELLPEGPYLLACNHLSWVDPFLLLAWLPASPRIHFLGRRSAIYNRRWKRRVLDFMGGVIPVESGEIRHVTERVGGVLARGGVVAIFPEGAVGQAEGALQRLRHGVVHFAADAGTPVVAVGLAGTHELWRGKAIALRVGATVRPASAPAADMAAIEAAMRAALPPYAEPGGARPWPWLTTLLR